MSKTAHTLSDNIDYAQKASTKARQKRVSNTVRFAFTGILFCLIPTLVGVEYALTFSIMDLLFGAELPTDPTPFQVYVLAGSAMMAVVAMHVFIEKHPKHPAVLLIDKVAPYGLVLFLAGLVALFTSVDFHSLDAASIEPLSDTELFGDPVLSDSGSGALASWLDTLIGIGLGALIIVNVSVIHKLITIVRDNLPKLVEERALLNAIIRTAKRILHRGKTHIDAQREIKRRGNTTPEDLALETSADIEAAVAPTVRKLSKMLDKDQANRPASNGQGSSKASGLPADAPLPKDIAAFIKEVEALTASLPTKLVKFFQ